MKNFPSMICCSRKISPNQDIKQIKKVAVDLLAKVKAKIAELDHWTDKQETKAAVDNLIRDTLWAELPESYDEISISGYRQKIYEYVYTRYPDVITQNVKSQEESWRNTK